VGLDRVDFYFASLSNTYTGMYAKESRLAMQSIIQEIFVFKYPEIRLNLDFLAKDAGLIYTLMNKPYDVIATTGLDYLELKEYIQLRPLVILSKTDQPTDTFLLVTRKNNTLETLARLPERTLMVEAGGSDMAQLWLDTILKTYNLPRHHVFFNILHKGAKPSRTILPVFFRQADACVVSESALKMLSELNPQIKEELAVQERSAGYVNMLLCATHRLEDWAYDIVLEETKRMHTNPAGQQILTMMQMKRFFPFKPKYLHATKLLYRRSNGWTGEGN
jgi:ABC-type phosphate/phosphonate transport system substrate-binding protein